MSIVNDEKVEQGGQGCKSARIKRHFHHHDNSPLCNTGNPHDMNTCKVWNCDYCYSNIHIHFMGKGGSK